MPGQQAANETTYVTSTTVACDGDKETGGHPRVFLKLDSHTHEAVCPYCSAKFKLDPNAKVSAAH